MKCKACKTPIYQTLVLAGHQHSKDLCSNECASEWVKAQMKKQRIVLEVA